MHGVVCTRPDKVFKFWLTPYNADDGTAFEGNILKDIGRRDGGVARFLKLKILGNNGYKLRSREKVVRGEMSFQLYTWLLATWKFAGKYFT